MKIYYAHPIYLYNTKQEERDLELLKSIFKCDEIYNPNNPEAQEQYEIHGLEYFTNYVIANCGLLIFRGTPEGKITAGVHFEIQSALEQGIPVMELPSLFCRAMSVVQTKDYLKEIGYR